MFAQPARQASSRFRSQSQRSASSVSSSGGSDGSSLESPDAAAPFQDSQQQQQQLTAPIHNGQGIFLQSQSISRSDDGFELVSSSSANRHASAVSATSSPSISVSSAREPLSPILTSDVSLSEPSAVSLPRTHFKAIRRRASEVHDLDLFKDTLAHSTSTTTKPSTRDVVDDDLSHSIHALSAGLNPSIRPRHSYRTISHSRGRQRNKRRSATAIQSDASSNKRSCQSLSPASHPASLHPVNRSTASATARGPTSTRKQSQHSQLRHKSALQSLLRIDSETCALLATQPAGSTHVDHSWKVSEHLDHELGHLPSLQAALLEVAEARPSSVPPDDRPDERGSWWSDVAMDPASSIRSAYDYCHRYLSSSIPV